MAEPSFFIGAHTSAAKGVANALYHAERLQANCTQLFTANQRQWKPKSFNEEDRDNWYRAKEETSITQVISHASYLINLCSDNRETAEKSFQALKEEILRCRSLGIEYINFHPGSSKLKSSQVALGEIVEAVKRLITYLDDGKITLLFETTAGQGSQLGYKLEHQQVLVSELSSLIPVGVCVDTCHSFAAGYPLDTQWSSFIDDFDRLIGVKYLKYLHLNDSRKPCGSRVDRHAALGDGAIGWGLFESMIEDKRTRYIPKILETPDGDEVWKSEIAYLKDYCKRVEGIKD